MQCCKKVPTASIQLTRGDDSNALGHYIRINITTDIDMTGWYAVFQLARFQWRYNDITSGVVYLDVPRDISAQMPVGAQSGAMKIYDGTHRCRTVVRNIPFFINDQVVANTTGE